MKKSDVEKQYPKGQTAKLHNEFVKSSFAVLVGVILLACLLILNGYFARVSDEEVKNTMLLNRFQYSSKTLTDTVRAYVITNDDYYLEKYQNELEKYFAREEIFNDLKHNNLSDYEMETIDKLQQLSKTVIPLEEEAIAATKNGKAGSAQAIIYSKEYETIVESISESTYIVIDRITTRLEEKKRFYRQGQLLFEILFLLDLLYIVVQWIKTIRFSYREILAPISEVSTQMKALSEGNFHSQWERKEDDSEVGQMVANINRMKSTVSGMIEEISYALTMAQSGDYRMVLVKDYEGEFGTIKKSLIQITQEVKKGLDTIQIVANEVNSGANQLAIAADSLAEACAMQAGKVSDIMMLISELRENICQDERQVEEAFKISKASESALQSNQTYTNELREVVKEIDENQFQKISHLTEDSSQNLEEIMIGANETSDRIENIISRLKQEIQNVETVNEDIMTIAGSVDDNSAKAEEVSAISEEQKAQVEMLVQLLELYRV